MKGFITNIEEKTLKNDHFRQVLYTSEHCQLVVMSLKPKEDIGLETHDVDQFIRCEAGTGKAELDGEEHKLVDGTVVIVPAGTEHNITNTSDSEPLKLYTLYAPPHHRDGAKHKTKEEAENDETDEFDGKTSEE